MSEEQSDKHGPRMDDELKHETEGLVRSGGSTHAEPGKDPEPVDTDTGRDPTAPDTERLREGTPKGMTPRDVQERSALATALAGMHYPATTRELARHAVEQGAPDVAVQALERLPGDREFGSLAEVVEALGVNRESGRS